MGAVQSRYELFTINSLYATQIQEKLNTDCLLSIVRQLFVLRDPYQVVHHGAAFDKQRTDRQPAALSEVQ